MAPLARSTKTKSLVSGFMLPVGFFKISLAGLTKFKERENEMNLNLEDVIK